MKHVVLTILLLIGTTACETNKSGAEVSAIGESLVSEPAVATTETPSSIGPAIDYNARTATSFASATTACQAEGRTLCTKDQLLTAYSKGEISYTCSNPGNYWMVQTPYPNARNVFQVGCGVSGDVSYIQTTTGNRKFYCCL